MKKRSRRFKILVGTISGLALLLGASTTAYAAHFAARALPGVSVGELDISGQTTDEARLSLSQQADAIRVSVDFDDESTEYTLAELGVQVDIDATIEEVFDDNGNLGRQLAALFSERNVPVTISIDETVVEDLVTGLAKEAGGAARDAEVRLAEGGESFEVSPSATGIELDSAPLVAAAEQAARTLTDRDVELVGDVQDPDVSTEQAQEYADQANELITLEVSVAGRIDTHAATAADKAQWFGIDESGEPTLDAEKVAAWVAEVAESTRVEAQSGVQNVNSSGEVVSTPQPGVTGWTVNNADDVAEAIVAAMTEAKPYWGEFN
ncbi:MAG: peptidoglycan binding domain-containing protein, partial [Brooklawnia sp.]